MRHVWHRWEACLDDSSTAPGPHCQPNFKRDKASRRPDGFPCSENGCMERLVRPVAPMPPRYNRMFTELDQQSASAAHHNASHRPSRCAGADGRDCRFEDVSLHAKFHRASCEALEARFGHLLRSAWSGCPPGTQVPARRRERNAATTS